MHSPFSSRPALPSSWLVKAANLNGKRGVVVVAPGIDDAAGGAPPPKGSGGAVGATAAEMGKVTVRMDANGRVQAAAFENLQRV